ncbi:MAG: tetratricopeptide repeat protein [Deltaproteobacteria bacterium]|nr:tetratricopeptide repeat protein [Deltaproteobacteria bacterium]
MAAEAKPFAKTTGKAAGPAPPAIIADPMNSDPRVAEWNEYMSIAKSQGDFSSSTLSRFYGNTTTFGSGQSQGDFSLKTLLRLTDAYLDAKDAYFRTAMEEHERQLELFRKGALKKEPLQPVHDYSHLINGFQYLLAAHPHLKGADALHYLIGYALYESAQQGEAAAWFENVVKKYPRSQFALEASFRLGEIYFETGQMGEAAESYKRIIVAGPGLYHEKALYKLGWVYYKTENLEKSVDAFTKMLDMERSAAAAWKGGSGLAPEAISGAVMSLAHFKDADTAVEFIRALGPRDYSPRLLALLGEAFADAARYEHASKAYKTLVDMFPDYEELPLIYKLMASLSARAGNIDAALKTSAEMLAMFNTTAPWYKKTYPKGAEKIDAVVIEASAWAFKQYHKNGREKSDMAALKTAIDGYTLFLASYPSVPSVGEMRLLLAEAYFDSKMYAEAAVEYEKAAALGKDDKKGEMFYSAMLAVEIVFYGPGKDKQASIETCDRILKTYPIELAQSGKLEKAIYKTAEMYGADKQFDKARDRLSPLLKDKKNIAAYQKSAELYLAEGNLTAAAALYVSLVENSKLSEYKEVLTKLRFRIAEDSLNRGALAEAIERFHEAHKTAPGSKTGELSLARAAQIAIRLKKPRDIEASVKRIVEAYPGTEWRFTLLAEAGRSFEAVDAASAGRFYELASNAAPKPSEAAKLLFAAGVFYESASLNNGNGSDEAEAAYKRYLLLDNIPTDKALEAAYRLGSLQLKMGKKSDGMKTLKKLAVADDRSTTGRQYPARAKLILLRDAHNDYLKIALTQPFEETFERKNALLDKLLKDYAEIAEANVPELLPEVFYYMGQSFENFKDAILLSERPSELAKDELEEYNFLLEEKAYTYDEQAVKAYENSLYAGRDQRIYTESLQKSLERLAFLKPAIYKRGFGEAELAPLYIMPEPASKAKETRVLPDES